MGDSTVRSLTKRQVESITGPSKAQSTWNKNTRALIFKTLREGTTRVERPDPFHPEDRGRVVVAPELERRMNSPFYARHFDLIGEIKFAEGHLPVRNQYRAYLQFLELSAMEFPGRKDATRTERELLMVLQLAVLETGDSRPVVPFLKQSRDLAGRVSWQRCQDGIGRLVKAGRVAQHQVNSSYSYEILIPVDFSHVPADFDAAQAQREIVNALSDSVGMDFNSPRIEKYSIQQENYDTARANWKAQQVAAIAQNDAQRKTWFKGKQDELRQEIVKNENGRVALGIPSIDALIAVLGVETATEMTDAAQEVIAEQPVKVLVSVGAAHTAADVHSATPRRVSFTDYPGDRARAVAQRRSDEVEAALRVKAQRERALWEASKALPEPPERSKTAEEPQRLPWPEPRHFRHLGDGAYDAYKAACKLWQDQNPDKSLITGKLKTVEAR